MGHALKRREHFYLSYLFSNKTLPHFKSVTIYVLRYRFNRLMVHKLLRILP